MLLGFLKDGPQAVSDFYVRYHTVQLLTALAAGGPYRLQRVSNFESLSLLYVCCCPGQLCEWAPMPLDQHGLPRSQ